MTPRRPAPEPVEPPQKAEPGTEPTTTTTEPTIVTARLARGREIGPEDFADLTSVAVVDVAWAAGGALCIEFAGPLSTAEAEAVARRIMSRDPVEEKLRADAAAYLSITNPTEAQRNEQMDRLTLITLNGPTVE